MRSSIEGAGMSGKRLPKIIAVPPGPKARMMLARNEALTSAASTPYHPLVVESGSGCIVVDVDGNEFLDFDSGSGVRNLGLNHPRVTQAVREQSERLLQNSSKDSLHDGVLALAERLFEITPGAFPKKVLFENSGAEAVDAAIKIARWHSRRPYVGGFVGGFHGQTLGAASLSACGLPAKRYFAPLLPGVFHVPYPHCYRCPFGQTHPDCDCLCLSLLDEALHKEVPPEEVAAIVFESVQTENGLAVPPPDYFKRLWKLVSEYDIILVDDEWRTGFGRTGRWFGIEHWRVEPDMVCVSNSLASGFPLSVVVAKHDLMDWEQGSHTTFTGGSPVGCSAAMATVTAIRDEKLMENAERCGRRLTRQLSEMMEAHRIIGDVRGLGLMVGVELVKDRSKRPAGDEAERTIRMCFRRGLILGISGESTIRMSPPLIVDEEQVDLALSMFEEAIASVERESLIVSS